IARGAPVWEGLPGSRLPSMLPAAPLTHSAVRELIGIPTWRPYAGGCFPEAAFQMLALALLFGGKNALVISLSGGNHVKNDACQFVGGSRGPSRPSQTGAPLAIKDAQIGSAPFQGLGR